MKAKSNRPNGSRIHKTEKPTFARIVINGVRLPFELPRLTVNRIARWKRQGLDADARRARLAMLVVACLQKHFADDEALGQITVSELVSAMRATN